jgi:hypothetical protein
MSGPREDVPAPLAITHSLPIRCGLGQGVLPFHQGPFNQQNRNILLVERSALF